MKDQTASVHSRIFTASNVSNFTELERLKALNDLLKRANPNIENVINSPAEIKKLREKR